MKPRPGLPPDIGDVFDGPVRTTIDILSEHIMQIEKNCSEIEELATKVDKLVEIIRSCPHCLDRLVE